MGSASWRAFFYERPPGMILRLNLRISIKSYRPHIRRVKSAFRLVWHLMKWPPVAAAVAFVFTGSASAQTELSGPVRDIARAAIVYPVVFDPLIVMPLNPGPEAVLDAHGADITGTVHAALRSGDNSYGIVASVPLSSHDATTLIDPRGMRPHASLGFHLTNVIWRPKAKAVLERQLGPEGFIRLTDRERDAAAQTIETMDAVDVPWVVFVTADYRFNRAEYVFADPATLDKRFDTRLNDTASMLGGVQLFARRADPGYFFGFSYTYTAVFDQFGGLASNGLPAFGPAKVRGNVMRVEMRRPWVGAGVGFNPSLAYEVNSRVKTVEGVGYWWLMGFGSAAHSELRGVDVGVRAGYTTDERSQGGAFVSVFIGAAFPFRW
jgi:hypothetical protein